MTDDLGPDANPDDMLDGNVSAGLLASVFGAGDDGDHRRCAHCGDMHAIGELPSLRRAPGTILRCPTCDGVVIRSSRPDGHVRRCAGAAYLRFERV